MFWLYDCNGTLRPCDTLEDAQEGAALALEAADDFERRMGWAPFWARAVEIRQGRKGLLDDYRIHGASGGDFIAQNTRLYRDHRAIRRHMRRQGK